MHQVIAERLGSRIHFFCTSHAMEIPTITMRVGLHRRIHRGLGRE